MSEFFLENALWVMIGLAVAFLACLGLIVFGWFQWRRETTQRLAVKSAPVAEANGEPSQPPIEPTAPIGATPAGPVAPELADVPPVTGAPGSPLPTETPAATADPLRLLRDPSTGKLLVEIGGQIFAGAREIRQPEHQRLLLGTTRDLLLFLGQARAAAALPATPAANPGAPGQAPDTAHPPVTANLTPAAVQTPAATGALRLPSMNPFQQLKVVKELSAAAEAPDLTIAQQIDNLLQDLTAVSPLTGRGLRVAGTPSGLVSFELDGQSYADIDAVPDSAARDLLRAAVKRWEAQAG